MMKRLRVVHVVNSLACGGLEQLVCQLARRRGGDSTQVLCLYERGELSEQLDASGVEVQVAGPGRLGSCELLPRVVRSLRQFQPHIVHCHNLPALTFGGLAAHCLSKPGLVFTKHGASRPGRGRADRLRRWLCRRGEPVAVSREIQKLLSDWIADERTAAHFVPNGIDFGQFTRQPEHSLRRERGWGNDFLIIVVARLTPEKDHVTLLQAFKTVSMRIPAARLLIVGDGPTRQQLLDQMHALKLKGRVEFLGSRSDIPALLHASNLFVLSSQTEGIPLAVLEAMAAGVPVLATRVGGIPGVIEDDRTGCLVAPRAPGELASAMLRLAGDPIEAARLAAAARRAVMERFALEQTVEAYEDIYQVAADGRSGRKRDHRTSRIRHGSRLQDISLS